VNRGCVRADADTAGLRCSWGRGSGWIACRAQGRYSPKTPRRLAGNPNLWGAVVGRPSLLKSPALAEVMKPLGRLVAEAYEEYQEA
jgi:hypothetical protein